MQVCIFRKSTCPSANFLHDQCNMRCKISDVAAFMHLQLQKAIEVCHNKDIHNIVMCVRLYCVLKDEFEGKIIS